MATYSSAFSMCYHLLVILLMCTILDVAASVDEDGGEDGEDLRGAIPPASNKQKIGYIKRDIDAYRYWATMQTAKKQADAWGDARFQAHVTAAEEAFNEYVELRKDGSASEADRDMAFMVLKEKMVRIVGHFIPSLDRQELVQVGELFVETLVKLDSGVLPGNSEIERQLDVALTKWTNLLGVSYNRKLTPQERKETAQIKKNLNMIFGKSSDSAGFTKVPDTGTTLAGRLRGCLSLTLGAALLSTFLWLVGRRVFSGKSLGLLTSSRSIDDDIISEAIEYSKHSGTTGQATSSSSIVVLLATVGLIIVIIGLLLYYFSDRIWPKKKITKKRRTTKKSSQLKTGESSPTKSRESNLV